MGESSFCTDPGHSYRRVRMHAGRWCVVRQGGVACRPLLHRFTAACDVTVAPSARGTFLPSTAQDWRGTSGTAVSLGTSARYRLPFLALVRRGCSCSGLLVNRGRVAHDTRCAGLRYLGHVDPSLGDGVLAVCRPNPHRNQRRRTGAALISRQASPQRWQG